MGFPCPVLLCPRQQHTKFVVWVCPKHRHIRATTEAMSLGGGGRTGDVAPYALLWCVVRRMLCSVAQDTMYIMDADGLSCVLASAFFVLFLQEQLR